MIKRLMKKMKCFGFISEQKAKIHLLRTIKAWLKLQLRTMTSLLYKNHIPDVRKNFIIFSTQNIFFDILLVA